MTNDILTTAAEKWVDKRAFLRYDRQYIKNVFIQKMYTQIPIRDYRKKLRAPRRGDAQVRENQTEKIKSLAIS
ncbi:MAG: hypothetical protein AAB429_03405, partial [Patescibacteria group bacterium]